MYICIYIYICMYTYMHVYINVYMYILDSRHGGTMQADRCRACNACSVDGLSVGAVVGGNIQPGRCGQGGAARAIRPGRCGPVDAAGAMRPG